MENEIDELAKDMYEVAMENSKKDFVNCLSREIWIKHARILFNQGYRKQSQESSDLTFKPGKVIPLTDEQFKELCKLNAGTQQSKLVPSLEDIEIILHSECDKSLRKYNKIRTMEVAQALHDLLTKGVK